jgi:hypothetical protein
MSTVNNGPQIVRSGLALSLDASSRKSYPAIEALIVAGGGSGGVDNGGGGGGGGVISTALNISVNTAYSIVVGAGGASRLGSSDDGPGNNGANSTAFGYTAIGGSGGTGWVNVTLPPGSATYSGGSGAGQSAATGGTNSTGAGTGTSGQGNNGGTAVAAYAGGGGGAGGLGGNATSGNVGAGGEGLYVGNLFGYSVGVDGYVAGGGAGGFDYISGYRSTLPFTRNGTTKKLTETGEDACPNNTGAGGNGANHDNENSGAGGSGVVFVRYFGPQRATGGTIYSFRGYTIHRFDSNGTFTLTSGDTTTWTDLSGNGRNGALTSGPTFDVSNKGSIVFNGSTQYVTTSNIALSFTTFSMECLVKYTSLSGNQGLFTYNNTNAINLWKGSGVGMRWEVNTGGQAITGANDLATGVWYHFVGVYNGSQGILYRNGIVYAGPTTLTSHTSEAANFEIGRYNGAGNTNGNIAIARFYTRALTAAEVVQNYETTKTRFGL